MGWGGWTAEPRHTPPPPVNKQALLMIFEIGFIDKDHCLKMEDIWDLFLPHCTQRLWQWSTSGEISSERFPWWQEQLPWWRGEYNSREQDNRLSLPSSCTHHQHHCHGSTRRSRSAVGSSSPPPGGSRCFVGAGCNLGQSSQSGQSLASILTPRWGRGGSIESRRRTP